MIRPLSASLSGISASFKLLETSSGNIANADTVGYKAKAAVFQDTGQGVSAATSAGDPPGPAYKLDGRVFIGSNVDVASEMVSLISARHMLSLNAAAFRTATEMEKSLIDTLV